MGDSKRFEIFFEKHFGVGIRWESIHYPLHLSIALPFVAITIGFGRSKSKAPADE